MRGRGSSPPPRRPAAVTSSGRAAGPPQPPGSGGPGAACAPPPAGSGSSAEAVSEPGPWPRSAAHSPEAAMLGEGERTQRTRMRQSRDDSGRDGLGDAKAGGGGDRAPEAGRRRAGLVKQREEVARRPMGSAARHVAEGVESELSRNPALYGARRGRLVGCAPGAGSPDAQTAGRAGRCPPVPWNRAGLESRMGVPQLVLFSIFFKGKILSFLSGHFR